MHGTVGAIRIPILWPETEPSPGAYDFTHLDAQIGGAAAHGIRILPFVYGVPSWLAPERARVPLGPRAIGAWRAFLRALVRRYGNRGEFWQRRLRGQSIRDWQVWNEPNFSLFWPRPSAVAYARLLRISARVIRGADPRARIVLAGVAPVERGIEPIAFLRRLLRVRGIQHAFDIAAVHPYSTALPILDFYVRRVRWLLADAGLAKKPLLVSELGVASHGKYPSAFVQGEDGQARFLNASYSRLLQMRRRWRIAGVYWFAWQDALTADPHCAFCQGAGLFDISGRPKLAWWALRRIARDRRGALPSDRARRAR